MMTTPACDGISGAASIFSFSWGRGEFESPQRIVVEGLRSIVGLSLLRTLLYKGTLYPASDPVPIESGISLPVLHDWHVKQIFMAVVC